MATARRAKTRQSPESYEEYQRKFNATRVYLGDVFDEWKTIRDAKGFKTDSQFAEALLAR